MLVTLLNDEHLQRIINNLILMTYLIILAYKKKLII